MEFKLKTLAQINQKSLKKATFPEDIVYLDTKNLTNGKFEELVYFNKSKDKIPSRARRIVQKNDILISTVRPNQKHYGFITKDKENYIVSTGFAVITPDETKVNPYFLYKYLTLDSITNYLQNIAENSTSAYPAIKPSVLSELSIILPDKTIQDYISKLLRSIDNKIDLNEQIITNLEELSQTLFKRWFVDFEFPDENGNPYKSSGGEMVDSELGKIPKYWKVSNLDKIASFVSRGITPKYNENSDIQIPIINQKVNKGPRLDLQYIKYFDGQNRIKKELYAQKNDLLLNSLGQGTLGRIHLFTRKSEVFLIDQHISIIRFDNINYSYFYYAHINTELIQGQIDSLISGSTGMLMLNITKIRNLKVILPTEELVLKYSKLVNEYFGKITQLIYENENLTQLRNTLLPKLMSGELEIPDDIEVNEDELSI